HHFNLASAFNYTHIRRTDIAMATSSSVEICQLGRQAGTPTGDIGSEHIPTASAPLVEQVGQRLLLRAVQGAMNHGTEPETLRNYAIEPNASTALHESVVRRVYYACRRELAQSTGPGSAKHYVNVMRLVSSEAKRARLRMVGGPRTKRTARPS